MKPNISRILRYMFFRKSIEDAHRTKTIEKSREMRAAAEKRIDGMIAQVNGCGDRWFLEPMKSIDECRPDNNGNGG
jgi:hypothetical protein